MPSSTTEEVRAAIRTVLDRLQNLARVHHALQVPNHDTPGSMFAILAELIGQSVEPVLL